MNSDRWILKTKNNHDYYVIAYEKIFSCQIGYKGLISYKNKKEGDLSSPKGEWIFKSIYYRADKCDLKVLAPNCFLKMNKITKKCGWCDDPLSTHYNKYIQITKELNFSFETLWREDSAYDIFIELNYNQNPIIKNKGSAIFIHCSFKDFRQTSGCVAFMKKDLISLIQNINKKTYIEI